MRRLRSLFLLSIAALAGCSSGGGNKAPEPELFADPKLCDMPCEVLLDSGIEAEGRVLTFTWDVGGGPIEGEERLLHRFEAAGTYEVSVTVSDGGQGTSDTVTVRVEPQPKSTVLVDQSGGTVSQGAGRVTVPADIAPEAVAVELTELPSMQEAAERVLGVERFTALGKAYEVSMPLKTGTAIDIAVAEASGRDLAHLAWLVRLVGRPVLPTDVPPVSSRAPIVDYVLVPVTRVDDSGAAHGDIFARRRFQLVELSDPLNFETFTADATPATTPASNSRALTTKASAPPSVYVLFWDDPSSGQEGFSDAVKEGVRESYNVLVGQMGFVAPEGTITVVVGGLGNGKWLGAVYTNDHHTIHLIHTMQTADQVKKVIAHEFFHLIQHLNTNQHSIWQYFERDAWFGEGTADWAADEVFDGVPGHYHATQLQRFKTRLNQENFKNNLEYETVGFWKWADSYRLGIIRQIIEHKYLLTHSTVAGAKTMVENTTAADYLTSLKALWSDIDFLTFVYDARYEKDFDTDEDGQGELWGPKPNLGAKKIVDTDADKSQLVAAEVVGDGELNPLKVNFSLKQRLTADVLKIGSLDLEGTLHIKFPITGSAPVDAQVLILNAETHVIEEEYTLRDLSKKHSDVEADFDSDKEAVVLLVDGRWSHMIPDDSYSGEIEVWVENPCGPLPAHDVEVTTEAELQNALLTMPAGSVIKLAAGGYSPAAISWPINDLGWDTVEAVALVRDLTLVGAGKDATTLYVSGGAPDAYLYTWGDATLRDLTIEVLPDGAFFSENPGTVSMCNIDVNFPANQQTGYQFAPPSNATATLNLYESAITRAPGSSLRAEGVSLNTCWQQNTTNSIAVANIYESRVDGWTWGVRYDTGTLSFCNWTAAVNTDCKGFSNELFNVMEQRHTSDTEVTFHEHCPSP